MIYFVIGEGCFKGRNDDLIYVILLENLYIYQGLVTKAVFSTSLGRCSVVHEFILIWLGFDLSPICLGESPSLDTQLLNIPIPFPLEFVAVPGKFA